MPPPAISERDKNHRFPGDIIRHGIWLSSRFPLRFRDGEALLCERGISVSHDAIRKWCRQFGQQYAHQLRHRRPRPGDQWHVDAVVLTRHGARHFLWRAVDQHDNVLALLVQSRRHKRAAKQCFRKLLKGLTDVPRVIMPDQRKSSGAAKREMLPGVEHRHSRSLKNRCESAQRPTRQCQRRMQAWKSAGDAQRFLSAYGLMAHHFQPRRHRLSASEYRQERRHRFESGAASMGTERAASRDREERGRGPVCRVTLSAATS